MTVTDVSQGTVSGGAGSTVADTGEMKAYRAGVRYFLGPLVPLLEDESVSEIMVNGPKDVFVERGGKISKSEAEFRDEDELRAAANNIAQYVGKAITDDEPILDGRLPDGSRVCIVLHPVAARGTSINIRRFLRSALTPEFLLERKAVTPEALEFILLAVKAEQNVVVSGGTGSGKTTLLNILSTAFDDAQRLVIIEDTRELQIQKKHVVQMEARPADAYGRGEITVRDLFVTSLRMRPDRIVVGEVRRGEALDMIQAMTSGHRGSLATLHADNPAQCCGRLETMCLMADLGLPMVALRRQIGLAIDLVVQVARLHTGRRLITHVSEIEYDEPTNTYRIRDIFALDTREEEPILKWTGQRPNLADEIGWRGLQGEIRLTRAVFDAPAAPRATSPTSHGGAP